MKPGYKQTEVGVIPEEWQVRTVRNVSDMVTVGFVGSMAHLFTANGVPLLRGQNVLPGQIDLSDSKFISHQTHSLWKKSALRGGDIVMVRVGYPGTSAVVPNGFGDANAASLVVVRPDLSTVDSGFVCWVLLSDIGRRQVNAALVGGAQQVINIGTAASLLLPVPPKGEQRAIATALSDVDGLLGALDRLIAKKRDLKQAAMQQLLTGQTRLPGFHGEWEDVKAGDVGRFRGGNGFPIKFQRGSASDYPFYKVSDMNNDGNETFMSDANNWISEGTRKQLGATVFPAGSIIFAKVGAAVFLERKKILTKPSCLDNNLAALVLDGTRAQIRFIHYALLNIKFSALVSTTALPSLSAAVLSQISFSLPPLPEQTAIAEVLSDMDVELAALEQRREKTRTLKQGMMQELLTGRSRLIAREAAKGAKEEEIE